MMELETEKGSKKVGHGAGVHELESDSTAAIDLLPPEMFESIYKFLPFPDLLTCREVSKKWKSVATDSLQKRCAPLSFTREDIPKSQRSKAIQSFCQLVRAANEQGDLEEFPVTEFYLELNSDFYWIEMDGSTLISQFLEAVRVFVKHIVFYFGEDYFLHEIKIPVPIPEDRVFVTFPNITKITLEVFGDQNEDNVYSFFTVIRKIIENSPNIKKLSTDVYNIHIRQSGAIRRWTRETGIEQKASLVTSFRTNSLNTESDLEYLNEIGFKLKNFRLRLFQYIGNTEIFKTFLKSQSDTLTTLSLDIDNVNSYQYFRELPCLPHVKDLCITLKIKEGEDRFPTLFYKELLPALETLDLEDANFAANHFVASHMTPSKSVQELILPKEGVKDAAEVIHQAGRLFPNLKRLQVYHKSAGPYMSHIYETLTGLEELGIILTDGHGSVSVDNIITGLPERFLRKIGNNILQLENRNISYHLSKALAMLERGTTKTLASLENLRNLAIYRRFDVSADVVEGADFTELSGVVLKQMKGLQQIDFGVRKYGPIVSAGLKEDLESQGIKLVYQRPPYVRSRTDFIVSLSESDDPDSDPDYN